ncbi:Zn-dependent protease [Secundilactobacillus pentosiphilus]|uniref:Zn-dependent protease n=1 Tax=Secundilactobacillus pentosiphilus TaxID=1714682 RepID=A0A1Z5IRN6_9LACO|nr:matrixin family metalloprotease [Secundilactobacillus pentosiphilus]GAX04434.1 Zn-dependent protease [Secundilactobacillus pentosiphilus]GAX05337.1 Zn-dependent protease [Secundilactobacillus pentosiphilus]
MRYQGWLTWVTLGLAVAFIPMAVDSKPAPINFSSQLTRLIEQIDPNFKTTTQQTQKREISSQDTPIEAIVQNRQLARTYYYHFDTDVSAGAKIVFENAISTYNQTGIVKLLPGSGTGRQNSITFFVYSKRMPSEGNTTMIESGHGGPQIIQQTGWNAYTANHARAGLNVYYPAAAIRKSVAIHELGHALGLDHSRYRNSVMYPIDQGNTNLSAGDIGALKTIYGSGETKK